MANPTPASSHGPAPEELPSEDMFYEEPFYSGRQTALLFGGMGLGFLLLLVLLFVIAG